MEAALRKLVVRTVDGAAIAGFGREQDLGEQIRILDRKGKEQAFSADTVKAVFFVKDFAGDSKSQDLQFLSHEDPPAEVWVRLELCDGEILECRVRNDADLLFSPGIHVWPSDRHSNYTKAYVIRRFIRKFAFLGAR